MKKFIEFASSMPCAQKEVYRTYPKKIKKENYQQSHLSFRILNGFLDTFVRFYSTCILLRIYQKEQQNHQDLIFETKKMNWGMQKDMWNWYEIPISKIDATNEEFIFELIKKSYEITVAHSRESNLKEEIVLYKKINDLEFNEKQLFNLIVDHNNAKGFVPLLKKLKKQSVLLIENKEKKVIKGISKLGGHPDLPLDFVWPHYENKPLTFLGQINLSEIENNNLILPKVGMLYFFASITTNEDEYFHFYDLLDEHDAVKVFYTTEPKENLKRKINNYFSLNQVVLDNKIIDAYPEYWEEPVLNDCHLSEEDIELVNTFAYMYAEMINEKLKIKRHHNLLGYHRPTQDMHPGAQEKRYINLFQLSGSDNTNLYWCDGGMFYIYIDENDLKNLDFSKIIVDAQSG